MPVGVQRPVFVHLDVFIFGGGGGRALLLGPCRPLPSLVASVSAILAGLHLPRRFWRLPSFESPALSMSEYYAHA